MGLSLSVWVSTLISAALAFGSVSVAGAQRGPLAQEYEVKAAYVFNFASFVTWPPSAFASPTAPILIGVLDNSPMTDPLVRAIQGELIAGRPIEVRRGASVDDIKACHILFVGARETKHLALLQNAPVLTIGEAADFVPSGGMIQLVVTSDNKIAFDVNLDAMNRVGLRPNARLLKVARQVVGRVKGPDQ